MKKRFLFCLSLAGLMSAGLSVALINSSKDVKKVEGYSASSLPTTIDLNDTSAANIRSYYSDLNNLSTSERQGTNLLKNLKTILKNGQKYFSYESGENVWKMYEITDRDWDKSPASAISGYNSSTKIITGYSYNTSDPYLHALYVNRDVNNQTTAWSDHQQTQWGINREHVWPKAEGFYSSGAGGARGDPRHLVAGNGYANNIHSNYYYGYVKASGATDCGSKYSNLSGNLRGTSKTLNSGTVFEPQDSDKGDIARMIFYMVARYNYLSGSDSDGIDTNNPNLTLTQNISDWSSSGYTSSTSTQGKLGVLTDLLAWHKADPVDEYEIHRNNLLYTNFTNNRNPFIDFPEWADYIWGTATYNGTNYQSYNSNPTGYATPSSDTVYGYNSGSSDPVAVTGVSLSVSETSIKVGESEVLSVTVSPFNATNQFVTWASSNTSVATVSSAGRVTAVAEGNSTITVTTSDGGYTATCDVTVTASGGGGGGESGTETGSVTAANGALEGWTSDGLGTAYKDGSAKFDSGGDNIYKTDIFSGDVSSGMTSLTVTINGKINGTPTAANSYKVEALDSSGNVLASDVKTGADIVTTSYGDTVFTIDSGLSGCTGIKITYVTKGGGNWGIMTVSWSAEYSSGEEEKTLDSITLDTSDAPTTFNVGDTFSYEGLSVTANYDDGTDDIVSPTSVSTPNMSTAGEKTVTVSYTKGGVTKTATYTITVNAVTLTSIEVSDAKTAYYVGDTFVKPTVTATFSNGSTSDVTNSATFSGYDLGSAGNQTVSVSYTNVTTQSTSYSITVTSVTLTSITISGYTTSFKAGDTFSFGGTVTAHYNNGSSADVTASASFSGYNMSSAGNQTVTVSYGGQTETYQISVTDDSGATDSTQYILINSTSDLEAGKSYIITNGTSGTVRAAAVTDNANNRKSTETTISNSKITRGSSILSFTLGGSSGAWTFATENYAGTEGYLASGSGSNSNHLRVISTANTATISFSGDAATINIGPHESRTLICFNSGIDSPNGGFACYSAQGSYGLVYLWKQVTPKVLTSISLDTSNVKTTFSVGETFNYTGLVVTANYSNAPSSVVTPTSVSSPNMSTTGQKTVTVSYTEEETSKSANYTITVNSNPSIDWIAPTINVYSGSVLSGTDVNGWGVTYNDGAGHQSTPTYSQLTVKLGGTIISIPHTWSAEDDGKTLTVTYNSLTTTASSAVQITQSVNTITQTTESSTVTSDLTFTGSCGGSGTADDGATWTVTSDATESTYDSTKGVHYGTGKLAVEYIQLVSDSFTTGTITQVVVNASGASGVTGSVSVTVGGNAFGEVQSFNATASDKTFTGTASAGRIVVRIYKAAAAVNAIYCKSVVVTHTVPGSTTTISNSVDHIAAQRVAVKFAKAFNAAMDTTSGCTTNLESAWSTCSSAYNTFLTEAAALGETEEAYAKSLIANATKQYTDDSGEACIERMMKTYQVCVQKHGQTPFMSELVSLSRIAINPLQVSVKNSSTAIIIIVISSISVIAIAGYFYFRKKKDN